MEDRNSRSFSTVDIDVHQIWGMSVREALEQLSSIMLNVLRKQDTEWPRDHMLVCRILEDTGLSKANIYETSYVVDRLRETLRNSVVEEFDWREAMLEECAPFERKVFLVGDQGLLVFTYFVLFSPGGDA